MKRSIKKLVLVLTLIAGLGLMMADRMTAQTFTTLYSFTGGSDGASPEAGLILSDSGKTLYGTALNRGSFDWGTVFAVNTNGTGFTTLHSFSLISGPNNTNSDGGESEAVLILSGNTLYGEAHAGGSSGYGTVFAVSTNGTVFATLYNFTGGSD